MSASLIDGADELDALRRALAPSGMLLLGVDGRRALIGNAGSAMWRAFKRDRLAARVATEADHPLDAWTRRVLDPVAQALGAEAVYPFETPHRPFLTWAAAAGVAFPSPLGLSIHPEYGLWHAYRAAFIYSRDLAAAPYAGARASPCLECRDRPCLSACPVSAFRETAGYDAHACRTHLQDTSDARCAEFGCLARHACPVGAKARYAPEHAAFHMRAFRG